MKQYNIDDLILTSITIPNASIENPNGIENESHNASIAKFSIGFDKYLNIDHSAVMVRLHTEIRCFDEKNKSTDVKANFTTQFIFDVKGLKEYVEVDDEGHKLENQLSTSILNIVYSTSRGLIYTRCLGTVMGSIILPVISSSRLVEISGKNESMNAEIVSQGGKTAQKKVIRKKASEKKNLKNTKKTTEKKIGK